MPGEHGLTLVSAIRKTSNAGIIILTGTGDPVDQAAGLELGADDYVAKPCDLRALLARVRSVLRRAGGAAGDAARDDDPVLAFAGWRLDPSARRLTSPDDDETPLTTAEFDLLCAFVERAGRVLTRDQLLEFYRNHYRPGNAVLVVVGDIDPEPALARIEEVYGGWETGSVLVNEPPAEPPQEGFRFKAHTGAMEHGYLGAGLRITIGSECSPLCDSNDSHDRPL